MLDIRPLSSELAKKAKEELHEDPARLENDVAVIKEWLSKSVYIKSRMDDQFLVNFLRGSKFSLEKTKDKIDMFYSMRTALPNLFKNRDPLDPKLNAIIKKGPVVVFPKPMGVDGPRVRIIRFGVLDPKTDSIDDFFKVLLMYQEIMEIEDDNYVVSGLVHIVDLQNTNFEHAAIFNPMFMRKMSKYFQEAIPIRVKGIHLLNAKSFFERVFNFMKSLLNTKIRSRVFVHSTVDTFSEIVPKDVLTEEYGGTSGKTQDVLDEWEKKLVAHRQFFLDDEKYGTDESKRPGKPVNTESLFGIEGSFRKLEVD